ncbi:hypothetical protein ACIBBG_31990 [Micromonospora chersina]|uniref:hypothetical protein n=1 Tax=Micromonospora chersina TaxID=47854 RepID=UPI00378ED923
MSATPAPPPDPTALGNSPFFPKSKVKGCAWQVTMDDAVAAAAAAGFRPTTRSGPNRLYVQRDWRTAAWITPTHGGVVVKPAWTTGQLVLVAAVITVLAIALCLPGVGA